jgi:hypothetical protein
METIELEKGWLERQMVEVRRDVANWPDVLKPLTTLNASLTSQDIAIDDRVDPKIDLADQQGR